MMKLYYLGFLFCSFSLFAMNPAPIQVPRDIPQIREDIETLERLVDGPLDLEPSLRPLASRSARNILDDIKAQKIINPGALEELNGLEARANQLTRAVLKGKLFADD